MIRSIARGAQSNEMLHYLRLSSCLTALLTVKQASPLSLLSTQKSPTILWTWYLFQSPQVELLITLSKPLSRLTRMSKQNCRLLMTNTKKLQIDITSERFSMRGISLWFTCVNTIFQLALTTSWKLRKLDYSLQALASRQCLHCRSSYWITDFPNLQCC